MIAAQKGAKEVKIVQMFTSKLLSGFHFGSLEVTPEKGCLYEFCKLHMFTGLAMQDLCWFAK